MSEAIGCHPCKTARRSDDPTQGSRGCGGGDVNAAHVDVIRCEDDGSSSAPPRTRAVVSTNSREKMIGPPAIRPDKVPDESLLAQLAAAVGAEDRDRVFDLAAEFVKENGGDLLPLQEVARRLTVSERSVWRRVADGDLPAPVHVGGSCRWPVSDVQAYLERIKSKRR